MSDDFELLGRAAAVMGARILVADDTWRNGSAVAARTELRRIRDVAQELATLAADMERRCKTPHDKVTAGPDDDPFGG